MKAFFTKFPKVAEKETRVLRPAGHAHLPDDEYALVEYYCDEPGCDCRRVVLKVWRASQPGVTLATFNYGWESTEFYIRWMRGNPEGQEMQGFSYEPFGEQSDYTGWLEELVEGMFKTDPAYVERLKNHYWMFKGKKRP